MKRFYTYVAIYEDTRLWYEGNLFTGVQFKDHKGQIVKSRKETFRKSWGSQKNETSTVCGIETEITSDWISLVGPIKGSYAIKSGLDNDYDCISNFGMRVEDPCQAADSKRNINFSPSNTTVKDIKYHLGTDSQFWLPKVC